MTISATTLLADKSTEGSIKNLINFADLPSTTILTNAQALCYQFLRLREMLERVEDTFSQGGYSDTLPARFLEAKSIHLIGDFGRNKTELKIYPPDDYERYLQYDPDVEVPTRSTGAPCFCTIDATSIILDVLCEADFPYSMWHYRSPAPLAITTNETNWLTDRYPHILTCAVKYYAFDHRQAKENAADELKKCVSYIERANIEVDFQKAAYTYEHHWER